MNLIKDFNIQIDDVITITGGGGKTSLMYAIGKELSEMGMNHVLTTTAKICISDISKNQWIISNDIKEVIKQITENPKKEWVIGKEMVEGQKISGFSEEELEFLHSSLDSFVIVNEGDGSKRKPYKFYNEYEPMIPRLTTKIIHVIGAEVLYQKINDEFFHRSELFGNSEAVFNEHVFIKVLKNFKKNKLGINLEKNIPKILLINKADGNSLKKARIMGDIGKSVFDSCYIGSLKEGWVQKC